MHESNELEQRIAEWRRTMESGVLDRVLETGAIDELEDHLREALHDAVADGASPAEAWTLCTNRLGRVEALSREYAKLEPSRLDRLVVRTIVAVGVVSGLIVGSIANADVMRNAHEAWLAAHLVAICLGYSGALTLALIGAFLAVRRLTGARWGVVGMHPRDQRDFGRAVSLTSGFVAFACAFAIVAGLIWSSRANGHAWSWDPREVGALVVLLYHAAWFAYRGPIRVEAAAAFAAFSGALTVSGWFGAVLFLNSSTASQSSFAILGSLVLLFTLLALGVAMKGSRTTPALVQSED